MSCGATNQNRPSVGSWVTYGLGSENQNLPGFIVLCPRTLPVEGQRNWRSSFLPGAYQGTRIDTEHADVHKLVESIRNTSFSQAEQRQQLELVRRLNKKHQETRRGDPNLESRIQSFELAYRMQMEAADAFDISREPPSVQRLYGEGIHARQLLIARRLLERGRAIRPGVGLRTAVGSPRRHQHEDPGTMRGLGSTDRWLPHGSQGTGTPGFDARRLGRRVRSHTGRGAPLSFGA